MSRPLRVVSTRRLRVSWPYVLPKMVFYPTVSRSGSGLYCNRLPRVHPISGTAHNTRRVSYSISALR